MTKAIARVSLLATLLFSFSHSHFLLNDYVITPRAADVIEKMSSELTEKTELHAYVIATNKKLERGTSLYDYAKEFDSKLKKPYAILIFAPNSKRLGVITSPKELGNTIDKDAVKKYAIDILQSYDSNSAQSKYDVAIVQSYSELADQLAEAKEIKLDATIKDESKLIIKLLSYIVWAGLILMIWILIIRPRFQKRK